MGWLVKCVAVWAGPDGIGSSRYRVLDESQNMPNCAEVLFKTGSRSCVAIFRVGGVVRYGLPHNCIRMHPLGRQVASLQLEMEAVYASLEDEALEIAPDAQGNRWLLKLSSLGPME